MPTYNLLPVRAFAEISAEPAQTFLQLAGIVEANFKKCEKLQNVDMSVLRTEFAEQIVALAAELGVGDLSSFGVDVPSIFSKFQSRLGGLKTRLRIRARLGGDPATVRLLGSTKIRIEFEIERLREHISDSDLSVKKKKALRSKLDELVEELRKERVSLSTILKIAASIATILGGTVAALAKAPEAAQTVLAIIELVGGEKSHEDEQIPMLMPPPKALPAPIGEEEIT